MKPTPLETMRQALDALNECSTPIGLGRERVARRGKAIATLKSAIAEMERAEPVGRFVHQDFGGWQQVAKEFEHHTDTTPLYTRPQDRDSIIEECIAAYSPDDSAQDWMDKLRALKGKK